MSLKSRVIASTLGCVAISFPLFLTACGDETTNVTETTGMTLVEKGAKMPDCTADNAGQMVYSTDSAAAFFCADGKWQSLKGEKGEQGIQGEQGPQGEPGEGKQGPKGEDGTGTKGDPGAAGKSCTAQKLTSGNGYKIVCGGDSVGVVLDGDDGTDGADGKSFVDGWMVDPRDKQLYKTVTIGEQIWMAENLNYATATGSSCNPNVENFCGTYGRLYTWAAAVGKAQDVCGYGHECDLGTGNVQGVCPQGWHLPSEAEWNTLFSETGGKTETSGTHLKSTSGWINGGNGSDDYGFSMLPAGRDADGYYNGVGEYAYFWSSTQLPEGYYSYYPYIMGEYARVMESEEDKDFEQSVRCIKDAE